jgi:alpha-tubulin suppressor-like RCC1 family protein
MLLKKTVFFMLVSLVLLCLCGAANVGSASSSITQEPQIAPVPSGPIRTNASTFWIKDDGSLWDWGKNQYGQLGDGTFEDRPSPVKIMDSVAAACGGMVIKDDGSLWSWGDNKYGQLRDGTFEDKLLPVKIMDHVVDVSTDGDNVIVLLDDGSLWAWGHSYATLKDNEVVSYEPIKILDSVSTFVDGGNNMALQYDGSLWAWGDRPTGFRESFYWDWEVHPPGPIADFLLTPIKVMDSVAAMTADGERNAVIKQDGSLWVWNYGCLWDWDKGSKTYSLGKPEHMLDSVTAISMGVVTIMAIQQDGSLWAWGENWYGQLGAGYKGSGQLTPIKVMDSVAAVSVGESCAMAIKTDGSLWVWGSNYEGKLGLDEEIKEQLIPKKLMDGVVEILGCKYALKQDGTLWGWGLNDQYQLGDGTNQTRYTPVKIMDHMMMPDSKSTPLFGLSSWASDEVDSLNTRGVIPTALKDAFQTPIHRDEFTALMVNVYESAEGPVTAYSSPFSDITNSAYKTAIEKAKTISLIDGTSANTFTPNGLLTREQAAKILCNVVSQIEGINTKPNGSPTYVDSAAISDWALDYVAYARENKIMQGSSSGLFNPKNNLTREEAMLVAERLIVQYGW